MHKFLSLRMLLMAALLAIAAGPAFARDQIRIVGSSTVYPYAKSVAEAVSKKAGFPEAILEKTGTGGGLKLFCAGTGVEHPDIAIASRPMKKREWNLCRTNGVDSITEVLFGRDGISLVMASESEDLDITLVQLYEALARTVPFQGKLVTNPNRKWSHINLGLPERRIQIYGPTSAHGTYDTILNSVLRATCAKKLPYFQNKIKEAGGDAAAAARIIKRDCSEIRVDGSYISMDQAEEKMIASLQDNPAAFGIFGYSVLFKNRDKLKTVKLNGVEPRVYTLADGSYPLSRPLYFYVKNAHRSLIPGVNEYVSEFMSQDAMGPFGYLMHHGLGVLAVNELKAGRYAAVIGAKMRRYSE